MSEHPSGRQGALQRASRLLAPFRNESNASSLDSPRHDGRFDGLVMDDEWRRAESTSRPESARRCPRTEAWRGSAIDKLRAGSWADRRSGVEGKGEEELGRHGG